MTLGAEHTTLKTKNSGIIILIIFNISHQHKNSHLLPPRTSSLAIDDLGSFPIPIPRSTDLPVSMFPVARPPDCKPTSLDDNCSNCCLIMVSVAAGAQNKAREACDRMAGQIYTSSRY